MLTLTLTLLLTLPLRSPHATPTPTPTRTAALMLLGNIDFGSGDRGVVGDVATMRRASDMLGCGDVQVS